MLSPSALSAVLLIFPAGMALAATMDLLTMTIPNCLCAALVVGYFILAAILGVPMQGVLFNISCGAAVLILTFGLFSLGWIGGGDAKLAAATALWLGWNPLLDYSLSAAMCGGALTLALLLGRRVRTTELDDQKRLDRQIAQSDIGRALWHRARCGRHNDLPANAGLAASRRAIVSAFPNGSGATAPIRRARCQAHGNPVSIFIVRQSFGYG